MDPDADELYGRDSILFIKQLWKQHICTKNDKNVEK